MKRLLLHIGKHKTGTTTIQQFLLDNKNELRQRSWDYISTRGMNSNSSVKRKTSSGYDSDEYFKCHEVKTEFFTNFLEESTADNVIISSENFDLVTSEEEIGKFKSYLETYFEKIEISVYLRRQDLYAISYKQQRSKPNIFQAFDNEISALPLMSEYAKKIFDYNITIDSWAKVFGKENIRVRILEKEKLYKNDLIKDFLNLIDLDYDSCSFKEPRNLNESMNRLEQISNHLLNEYGINNLSINNIDNDSSKLLPTKNEAIAFYECFKQSNKDLNKKYSVSLSCESIFEENFDRYPDTDVNITSSELHLIFKAVLDKAIKNNEDLVTDSLRDLAISIEKTNPKEALFIMMLAKERRNGTTINRKIKEYRQELKKYYDFK